MKKLLLIVSVTLGFSAHGAVFHVGPDMPYDRPSEVAAVAEDGDIIEIEAVDYAGDVAVWTQSDLVIRGIGGKPHLRAGGNAAESKAIWVIKGDNTIIENIEFSGAAVPDRNGAGIRLEGTNLTVRRCFFHDNENGILTGADAASDVLVEYSEFADNGFGDGYSHNIYIGRVNRFTLRFSYSHHARIGHQVKSRAAYNYLMFNRLMDGLSGSSSYLVDLPDPGHAIVIGNEMQQGAKAENSAMVHSAQQLMMANNTLVNDRSSGVFVRLAGESNDSLLQNNLFVGVGEFDAGAAVLLGNLVTREPGFVGRMAYDYRLTASSPAIDAGIPVSSANSMLLPDAEYVHPISGKERRLYGPVDIGAHEFSPRQ